MADALQTLDRDGRVFYVGTFSKSLFPSLRKGFVVVPDWAREAMLDVKRSTDSHCDGVLQAALAAFIADGHLARHIRRMRPIYAQRRQALERGAQEHWSDFMQVQPGNAGLHLSTRIADPAALEAVVECARQHLPGALPLSAYAAAPTRLCGLCIGYGGVEVDQITNAVQGLGAAMRSSRYWRGPKRGG